ncbi:MAG TPA: endonuclease III [Gemmatimonadaceae bacterium]|nr:endonuclease III [Gemmatimonadaceae bacterium]
MPRKSSPPRQPLSQQRPKTTGANRAAKIETNPPASPARTGTRPSANTIPAASRKERSRSATRPAKRPAQERAPEIYSRLQQAYPDARCALDFQNPYQLLVATILSAQCTDKRVNMVTPALFARYPDAESLAAADPAELEEMIRSTGFFHNKAKSLVGMATAVAEQHGGTVPQEIDQLVRLRGVGRKTANVILGNAYGRNEGVVVDTHVARVSQRLALTRNDDPVKIEQDLMKLFPREQWTMLAHLLIEHGRQICEARQPKCAQCVVNDLCPSSRV